MTAFSIGRDRTFPCFSDDLWWSRETKLGHFGVRLPWTTQRFPKKTSCGFSAHKHVPDFSHCLPPFFSSCYFSDALLRLGSLCREDRVQKNAVWFPDASSSAGRRKKDGITELMTEAKVEGPLDSYYVAFHASFPDGRASIGHAYVTISHISGMTGHFDEHHQEVVGR